jgi:hypothetical protein
MLLGLLELELLVEEEEEEDEGESASCRAVWWPERRPSR